MVYCYLSIPALQLVKMKVLLYCVEQGYRKIQWRISMKCHLRGLALSGLTFSAFP
jgi:hypothetical protein